LLLHAVVSATKPDTAYGHSVEGIGVAFGAAEEVKET